MSGTAEAARTLAGRAIVVTRPAGQATALAAAIAARGGEPIVFPVLAIADVDDAGRAALGTIVDRLADFDFAVFVSPNAVDKAFAAIGARTAWPSRLRAAAMGRESAAALGRRGVADVLAPADRSDSEALLALPELADVRGRRVVIFRGDGGRELLGDTLAARGAAVTYATCYRRSRPDADPAPLVERWRRGRLDAVTLTSSEGLANFWAMLDEAGQAFLRATPVFVPHARIAARARALGLARVIATGAGDAGLLAELETFFATL